MAIRTRRGNMRMFAVAGVLNVSGVQAFLSTQAVHPELRIRLLPAVAPKRNSAENMTTCDPILQNMETQTRKNIDVSTLSRLSFCQSGSSARKILDKALQHSSSRMYKSTRIPREASSRPISDADLSIQTNTRNSKYSIIELIDLNGDGDSNRASFALLSLFVASSFSAIVANQAMPGPEILRFLVVWIFSFAPLFFVGYGIATPSELQNLLARFQLVLLPSYRKRTIQHEAGHFLMGHLLGLPIQGYRVNSVRNAVEFYPLSDATVGRDRASALGFDPFRGADDEDGLVEMQQEDQPYFSKGGKGSDVVLRQSVFRNDTKYAENPFWKPAPKDEPKTVWPYRGFDHETLDKIAAISVAGACAEILAFGNAEGGYADFFQLRQFFNSADPELSSERDVENRIRYALGFAMGQLRKNLGVLDALAVVMEEDGSVIDCVLAIETCENNTSGATILTSSSSNYERTRRESFRNEGVGFFERILSGGRKNIDVDDESVLEGKGGGDRRKKFNITGDDPFYAAMASAVVFFLWASSGGLSLH